MIKVLIVDDDNLVRKGLISIMPWNEYNMEVVGEAKNGEKALECLAAQQVDLLLTDLAMPVMSGMELMRIVQKQYPHIFIVVLTLHQDFEYIQECLRLGAIDYIAKVELEKDSFGEIMTRIKARIVQEQNKNVAVQVHDNSWDNRLDIAYTLTGLFKSNYEGDVIEKLPLHLPHIKLDSELILWLPTSDLEKSMLEEQLQLYAKHNMSTGLLKLKGIRDAAKRDILHVLRDYMSVELFYEEQLNDGMNELNIDERITSSSPASNEYLTDLKKHGQALSWIHNVSDFQSFVEQLKLARMSSDKLFAFLNQLLLEWSRIYFSVTEKHIEMPSSFSSWLEVKLWLSTVRELLVQAIGKAKYSDEVKDCIAKAVKMMHDEMSNQLHASQVAIRVNMSRSYFSQCFKELVGMTFNEYLRHIRIEKAKEYLQYTQKTIQWITENTGYADQKYFSRVFQEKTGMLPSEFRQSSHL